MFGNDEKLLKAIDAMSEGNWDFAYQLLKKLSAEGVPDAEHFIGWFYEQGIVVTQSDAEAFRWCSKAAIHGVPESQNGIANMYHKGIGTEVDLEKAYYWYSIAYKNGDSASLAGAKAIEQELSTDQLDIINKKLILKLKGHP